MNNAKVQAFLLRPVDDLEKAAGIASRHDFYPRGFDVFDFSLKQFVRHLGLNEIVNARAATTPRGFRKFDEFQIWNCSQKLTWLRSDLLAVAEMAGFVVGHCSSRREEALVRS